jgi:phosphohistidine phosphatase
LLILRHAKADANRPGGSDLERKLNGRGRRAAREIGRAMRKHGLEPRLALCSPATRTRETLDLVSAEHSRPIEVRFIDEIYDADPEALLAILAEHGRSASPLLLVGHNPALHQLALSIARSGRPSDLDALRARFATGALAVFDVAIENWRKLGRHGARLQAYLNPRELV